jgi:hypothetical protein
MATVATAVEEVAVELEMKAGAGQLYWWQRQAATGGVNGLYHIVYYNAYDDTSRTVARGGNS